MTTPSSPNRRLFLQGTLASAALAATARADTMLQGEESVSQAEVSTVPVEFLRNVFRYRLLGDNAGCGAVISIPAEQQGEKYDPEAVYALTAGHVIDNLLEDEDGDARLIFTHCNGVEVTDNPEQVYYSGAEGPDLAVLQYKAESFTDVPADGIVLGTNKDVQQQKPLLSIKDGIGPADVSLTPRTHQLLKPQQAATLRPQGGLEVTYTAQPSPGSSGAPLVAKLTNSELKLVGMHFFCHEKKNVGVGVHINTIRNELKKFGLLSD